MSLRVLPAALLVCCAAVLPSTAAEAATKRPAGSVKAAPAHVKVGKGTTCVYFGGKSGWRPATSVGKGYYVAHVQQEANFRKRALEATSKKARKRLTATANAWHKKAKAHGGTCAALASAQAPPRTGSTPPPGQPYSPQPQPPMPPSYGPPKGAPLRFDVSNATGILQSKPAAMRMARQYQPATGSNLQTVDAAGATKDAVSSGGASIRAFMIAPSNKLYVLFNSSTDLANSGVYSGPGGCLLAEVDQATGTPRCVDSTLHQINWSSGAYGARSNPAIQFDATGAIYYTGMTFSGASQPTAILRRWADGVTTDLINQNVSIRDFLVVPDGSVFLSGSSSTGSAWTRRVLPAGGIEELREETPEWMRRYPDGNVYAGYMGEQQRPGGVVRYLTRSNAFDEKYWLVRYPGENSPESWFDVEAVCQGASPSMQASFCGSGGLSVAGQLRTGGPVAGQKVYGMTQTNGPGALVQYFPEVKAVPTAVQKVGVGQAVISNLVLSGRNAAGKQLTTLFDTSSGTETELIAPSDGIEVYHLNTTGNTVMFDGLRFSDNKYVLGRIDLENGTFATVQAGSTKWEDFQTFGR